jgi:ATP-binding cassette subfamily B protein
LKDVSNPIPLVDGPRKISFNNISFSYPSSNEILKKISFDLMPRKKTAIVGLSGAGKSTIGNLLFRLYDPQDGQILIDGQDVSTLKRSEVQKKIGVIPQDIVLFNLSLYENIHYGNPEASYKEVEKVCEICHLNPLIKKLPDGLQTIVGERGLKISGGEKQRVGIARALLKKPEIFILDEATSSLDNKTEKQIQRDIDAATKGVTTLIIAHRLQTITNCDKIIVLENGKVAEEGTHQELLSKNGIYRGMWEKQKELKQNINIVG